MATSTRKKFLLCLALVGLSAVSVSAQSNTVPAGYFTVTIAAGTGTSYSTSNISFPLLGPATASGQMAGQVTGITPTTITNGNAGWTAGQLSVAATPFLIQFTSGTAQGRSFLISTSTANTSTTLTIDPTDAASTDLTTLGIVTSGTNADTYQIIPADTISSVFGTPASTGVLGGTSISNADQIQLFNGTVWTNYFYNTAKSAWTQSAPPIVSNNVVIRPDMGVLYARLANTPLNLVLTGQAPSVPRKALVNNTSVTFIANYWPTDITLLNSNIQNIPGWTTGSPSVADTIQVYNSGNVWTQYYNNGSHWYQTSPPPINSDNVTIPAGTAVIISKKGSTAGQSILSQILPYSL